MMEDVLLKLDDSIYVRIDQHLYLHEIHMWAPLRETLVKVKLIIEMMNRGVRVSFDPRFLNSIYDLVAMHNHNVDEAIKNLPSDVDITDFTGGVKAEGAQIMLEEMLNINTKKEAVAASVFKKAEDERSWSEHQAIDLKVRSQNKKAEEVAMTKHLFRGGTLEQALEKARPNVRVLNYPKIVQGTVDGGNPDKVRYSGTNYADDDMAELFEPLKPKLEE